MCKSNLDVKEELHLFNVFLKNFVHFKQILYLQSNK